MPVSKGRQEEGRATAPHRSSRRSGTGRARWYGPLLITLMALGVIVIVANYMGLIPGTDGQASSVWLWIGLGILGAGFVGTSFWY